VNNSSLSVNAVFNILIETLLCCDEKLKNALAEKKKIKMSSKILNFKFRLCKINAYSFVRSQKKKKRAYSPEPQ